MGRVEENAVSSLGFGVWGLGLCSKSHRGHRPLRNLSSRPTFESCHPGHRNVFAMKLDPGSPRAECIALETCYPAIDHSEICHPGH
jgi:hypothetical protein